MYSYTCDMSIGLFVEHAIHTIWQVGDDNYAGFIVNNTFNI